MILELNNISKSFGENILFKNLSFEFEKGKVHSLLGANGSGKTTLFNILTGFIKADSGEILFDSILLNSKSPSQINKLGIARTFQDLRLVNGLTVKENILLILEKKLFENPTTNDFKIVNEILEKVSLLEHSEHFGRDLSYGQQKLLTLGCCLAGNPHLLLLDEPVAGIDNKNLEKIKSIVLGLKNEGITILQIEHNLEYLEETSDFIYLLEDGKIYLKEKMLFEVR